MIFYNRDCSIEQYAIGIFDEICGGSLGYNALWYSVCYKSSYLRSQVTSGLMYYDISRFGETISDQAVS
jgi:hypothetical protein